MASLSPMKKKLRLIGAYLRGLPLWCTWQVTYNCNFRCSFCHYWRWRPDMSKELSLDDFRIGAQKLAHIGSFMISLAGGEPLLRKDLACLVAILAEDHFPFITTNGWLVTRRKAKELFRAGLWGASISIDYCDGGRHDSMRGVKGAFQSAVMALQYFSEERCYSFQRVNLMAVLNHENLSEMEGLIELAGRCGAYFMVQPYGALKTGDDKFLPPDGSSAHLLKLKRKYKNFVSNRFFLGKFDEFRSSGVPGCRAGSSFFNIDNYGNVAKCVEDLDNFVGNILRDPIEVIIGKLREKNRLNQCSACWYNCRGEIESLYSLKGLAAAVPIFFHA